MPKARSAAPSGEFRRKRKDDPASHRLNPLVEALCREWGEVVRAILTRRQGNGQSERN